MAFPVDFFLTFSTEASQENLRTGWWGLWHMPPCHSAVGFIQQDSLAYQWLQGTLGFISMLVMLFLFPIFLPEMSFFSQDADMNENKLGWSWLCSGQRQCWQLALNHSHYSSLKSSIHSEITSCIMQTSTDQVSRGDDGLGLVFSVSSNEDIQGDWRVSSSRTCSDDRMMSHVQHYTQHLFWENTCHCAIFGCFAVWQGNFELSVWAWGFSQSR